MRSRAFFVGEGCPTEDIRKYASDLLVIRDWMTSVHTFATSLEFVHWPILLLGLKLRGRVCFSTVVNPIQLTICAGKLNCIGAAFWAR